MMDAVNSYLTLRRMSFTDKDLHSRIRWDQSDKFWGDIVLEFKLWLSGEGPNAVRHNMDMFATKTITIQNNHFD